MINIQVKKGKEQEAVEALKRYNLSSKSQSSTKSKGESVLKGAMSALSSDTQSSKNTALKGTAKSITPSATSKQKGVSVKKFDSAPFTSKTKVGNQNLWEKFKSNVGIQSLDEPTRNIGKLRVMDKQNRVSTNLRSSGGSINLNNIASKHADITFQNTVKAYNASQQNKNKSIFSIENIFDEGNSVGTVNPSISSTKTESTDFKNDTPIHSNSVLDKTTSNIINATDKGRGIQKLANSFEDSTGVDVNNIADSVINSKFTEAYRNTPNNVKREPITVKVNDDGWAPKGLHVGDKVVTGGGTYTIDGVLSDGSYKTNAKKIDVEALKNHTAPYEVAPNKSLTTANFEGEYADPTAQRKYNVTEPNAFQKLKYATDTTNEEKSKDYYKKQRKVMYDTETKYLNDPDAETLGNKDSGIVLELKQGGVGLTPDQYAMNYATDLQKKRYNYLWNKEGGKAANDYFEALKATYLNKEVANVMRSDAEKAAEDNKVGVTIATPFANAILQPAAFISNTAQSAKNALGIGDYKPVDGNSYFNQLANAGNQSRNIIAEGISNPVGKFAYEAGNTIGDMLASLGISGAIAGGGKIAGKTALGIMSTESAQSTWVDSLQRGASQNEAFANAYANGAIEALTERFSIGNAIDNLAGKAAIKNVKTFVKGIAKQAGIEATEEAVANPTQNLADQIILGDRSNYQLTVNSYIAQGMNKDNARQKAALDMYVKDTVYAAALGAVSGGAIGGASIGVGQYSSGRTIKNDSALMQDLANSAKNANLEKEYTDTADKILNGEKVGSFEVANMKSAISDAAREKVDNDTYRSDVYEYLGIEEPHRLVRVLGKTTGIDETGYNNKKFTNAWVTKSLEVLGMAEEYNQGNKDVKKNLKQYMEYADDLLYGDVLSDDANTTAYVRAQVNDALNGIKASAAGRNTMSADDSIYEDGNEKQQEQGQVKMEQDVPDINVGNMEQQEQGQVKIQSVDNSSELVNNSSELVDNVQNDNVVRTASVIDSASENVNENSIESSNAIGKKSGNSITYHTSQADNNDYQYGSIVNKAKKAASDAKYYDYDLIQVQTEDGTVKFIKTDDFNGKTEPNIESILTVDSNGNVKLTKPENKIITDKSKYVASDYDGFDVEAQQERENKWQQSGIRYNAAKIDNADYFNNKFGEILNTEVKDDIIESDVDSKADEEHAAHEVENRFSDESSNIEVQEENTEELEAEDNAIPESENQPESKNQSEKSNNTETSKEKDLEKSEETSDTVKDTAVSTDDSELIHVSKNSKSQYIKDINDAMQNFYSDIWSNKSIRVALKKEISLFAEKAYNIGTDITIDEYADFFNFVYEHIDDLFENRLVVQAEMSKENKAFVDYIKNTPILITDSLKNNITNFNKFYKNNMGVLSLRKDGRSADVVYEEIKELYPGYVDTELMHEADIVEHLSDVVRSIKDDTFMSFADYYFDGETGEIREYATRMTGVIVDKTLLKQEEDNGETENEKNSSRNESDGGKVRGKISRHSTENGSAVDSDGKSRNGKAKAKESAESEESEVENTKENENVSERSKRVSEGTQTGDIQEVGAEQDTSGVPERVEQGNDEGTLGNLQESDEGLLRQRTDVEGRREGSSGSRTRRSDDGHGSERNSEKSSGRVDSSSRFYIDRNVNPLSYNQVERASKNVDAIKLLKKIQAENRKATNEEKIILAQYSGFGGLTQVFADNAKGKLADLHTELKEILSDKEYKSARASILNAYYTPYEVIDGIYKVIDYLGVAKNSKILEPSCGNGYFIGCMPDSLRKSSTIDAVELDDITGNITKLIYDDANVNVQGFEEYENNNLNLIIGNVPFGNVKVFDKNFIPESKLSIHDYFISKGLSLLNDGGIMAVLTASNTLDSVSNKARVQFADKANLIAAVRIPSGTFNGTDIVTDLLIFQKKGENVSNDYAQDFVDVKQNDNGTYKNVYFVNHPEMILGTEESITNRYGKETVTVKSDGRTIEDILQYLPNSIVAERVQKKSDAMSQSAEETVSNNPESVETEVTYQIVGTEVTYPEDTLVVSDDVVYIFRNGKLEKYEPMAKVPKKDEYRLDTDKLERIKGMYEVLKARDKLIDFERNTEDDTAVLKKIKEFEKIYDKFVKKYGEINTRSNEKAYGIDSSNYARLCTVENVKRVLGKKIISKDDIFSKRVVNKFKPVESVDNVDDALIMSLNMTSRVDLSYMSKLYGKSEDAIVNELGDKIYKDPLDSSYVTADEYLSGNVREKLDIAEEAASKNPIYSRNVDALKKALPADLTENDIEVNLGSPWVGQKNVEDFIKYLCNDDYASVYYDSSQSQWFIHAWANHAAINKWGNNGVSPTKILENILNNKPLEIKQKKGDVEYIDEKRTAELKAKADEIKSEFNDWLWRDDARKTELLEKYNRKFNSLVERKVDGSYLKMPGTNPQIKLRPHQANAVAKAITQKSTMFVHPVGAGKTFAMIGSVMELKRLGIANKPLMAVPNNKIGDFLQDFYKMYPGANVLAVSDNDFSKANRHRMLAKIESGDYDCIIMRQSSFDAFPVSVDYMKQYRDSELEMYINAIESAKSSENIKTRSDAIRQIEKSIKSYKAKLDESINAAEKNTEKMDVFFDKCGIDAIIVDEAQNYKNLFFPTKLSRIKGITSKITAKSIHMHMITQMMHQRNNHVIFATATPVTNSLAEFYTMQRYLQPELLKQAEIESFDAWASTFGEIVSSKELNKTGTGIRITDRFSKFKNVPELVRMLRQNFDIVDKKDIKIKLPKAIRHHVQCRATKLLNLFNRVIDSGIAYASNDPAAGLKGYTDAKMASMDLRMIHKRLIDLEMIPPNTPVSALDFKDSKINRCVDYVLEEYKNSAENKGTQVIFLDKGVPNKNNKNKVYDFDLYNDIKTKLVRGGVNPDEIAFMQDANNDAKKKIIMDKMNSGELRILIGSTETAGVGLNIQERLVAAHHLDAPQRPADYEQRNGRIIRQGNQNEEVNIYNYSTLNSYDAPMWQMLDRKLSGINSVMSGDMNVRVVEDTGDIDDDFKGMSIEAANNPLLFELRDAQDQLAAMEAKSRNFANRKKSMNDVIKSYDSRKTKLEQNISYVREVQKQIKNYNGKPYQVENKTYDNAKDASIALYKKFKKLSPAEKYTPQKLGKICGIDVMAVTDAALDNKSAFKIFLENVSWVEELPISYIDKNGKRISQQKNLYHPESIFQLLNNRLTEEKSTEFLNIYKRSLESLESEYQDAVKHQNDEFDKAEELKELRIRVYELEAELAKNATTAKSVKIEMLDPSEFFDTISDSEDVQTSNVDIKESSESDKQTSKSDDMQYSRSRNISASVNNKAITGNISNEEASKDYGLTSKAMESITKSEREKAQSIKAIETEIGTKFKINIHTRRYYRTGQNVKGFYDPRHRQIHSMFAQQLGVIAHELGHHIDNRFALSHIDAVADDIEQMLDKVPDLENALIDDGYTNVEMPKEVIADFVWHYITDPDAAYEMGSYVEGTNFYDTFERSVDDDTLKNLQHIRNMVLAFYQKSTTERVKSTITTRYKDRKSNKKSVKDFTTSTLTQIVDYTTSAKDVMKKVEKANGGKISAKDNLQLTIEFAGSDSSMVDALLHDKFINPDAQQDGYPSFATILNEIEKPATKIDRNWINDFDVYLKSKHSIDWERRKKNTMSIDIAENVTEDSHENNIRAYESVIAEMDSKYGNLFENQSEKLYDWWDHFMRTWAIETGLMDRKLYDKLRKLNPHYVPMFRVMDSRTKTGNRASANNVANVFKRSKKQGSTRDTYSPLENLIIMVNNIVKAHHTNKIGTNIASLWDSADSDIQSALGMFVTEIEPRLEVKRIDAKNLKKILENEFYDKNWNNLSPEEKEKIEAMPDEERLIVTAQLAEADLIDKIISDSIVQFTPTLQGMGDNVVLAKFGEKTRCFEILDENFAAAIKALNPTDGTLAGFLKFAGKFTRAFAAVTTARNPIFAVSNAIRDFQHGWIMTQGKKWDPLNLTYMASWTKALGTALANEFGLTYNEQYHKYKAGKGFGSKYIPAKDNLDKTLKEMGVGKKRKAKAVRIATTPWTIFKGVINGIDKLNEAVESTPRYVAFKRAYKNAEGTEQDRWRKAWKASRESTVNFNKKGNATRDIANVIPFLGASIAGIKQFQELVTSKESWTTKEGIARLTRAMIIQAIPAILLTLLNTADDDETDEERIQRAKEYDEFSSYIKNQYWVFKFKDTWIRLPKDREVSAFFGTSFQDMVLALRNSEYRNMDTAQEWFWYSLSQLVPAHETVLKNLSDAINNKTWYGGNVVSASQEDMLVANYYQYVTDAQVSVIADKLAVIISYLPDALQNKLNVLATPKGLDYALDQTFGGIADIVLPMTTPTERGAGTLASLKARYTANPDRSNKYTSEAYDIYDMLQAAKTAKTTKNLDKEMTDEELDAWIQTFSSTLSATSSTAKNPKYKTVGDYFAEIRELKNNTELNYKEKEEKIDEGYAHIAELTQQLVRAYKDKNNNTPLKNYGDVLYPDSAADVGLDESAYKAALQELDASGDTDAKKLKLVQMDLTDEQKQFMTTQVIDSDGNYESFADKYEGLNAVGVNAESLKAVKEDVKAYNTSKAKALKVLSTESYVNSGYADELAAVVAGDASYQKYANVYKGAVKCGITPEIYEEFETTRKAKGATKKAEVIQIAKSMGLSASQAYYLRKLYNPRWK